MDVPADRINLEFVLGNKVMVGTVNANREHFEAHNNMPYVKAWFAKAY